MKRALGLAALILIIAATFYFGPKYKMVMLDNTGKNYIKTKCGSSLYKRCNSPVQFEWQVITKFLAPTIIIGPLLILLLKTKKEKIN